jgi:very-short-patch-repair endonuclease/virulence-associated protein VapD
LARIPSIDTFGEQMGILRNEFGKQRRHLPLRKLLEQAGEMIVRIKPIFMMSPLSVADFLRPDKIKFDFVIFDEASQVKPIEAFGALLRAENAVVVGDDKQLPPSNFFGQINDKEEIDDEDETSVVLDMESILDLFVTKNAKQTMLQWHYRSKHESLIAVSNKYFYENKLINLPSVFAQSEELGLQFKYLPDTNYASGKNEKEADYIIKALIVHSETFPNYNDCSIGIVAFGTKQKDCIENLLMRSRKQNAEFDKYISTAESAKEPFFVKNLENVQGDERDVIFVSICYGKNTEGKLFKRFGPINQKGGERRLNVLFTRARLKCILFSNFTAGDLLIEESDGKGLRIFKAFLDYAQNRNLSMTEQSNKPTDSPFEDSVKSVLEREGFEVRTQIGSAGYFVDLAIPHPEQKGRYLIGIECDGATYHSSKSARERDRLRQNVLEGLGWNIYRIWSTDWFRQPAIELKKLLEYITELKSGILKTITKESLLIEQPILEKKYDTTNNWKEVYQQAHLNMFDIGNDLHLVENSKLINIVKQILKIEAPVHQDYVKTLITQRLGIARIGNRIENTFNDLFILGQRKGEWTNQGKFVWLNDKKLEKVRDRSHLIEKLRQIEWISSEEIQLTLKEIVKQSGSIDKIELMKATIQTLNGGVRLTEGIRLVVEKEVDLLIFNRFFKISDNVIRTNN